MKTRFLNWRNVVAFAHDVAACAAAWLIAYALRFNFDIPTRYVDSMLINIAWIIPLQAVFFASSGMYRGLWRYASLPDLRRILVSTGLGALSITAVIALLRLVDIPRSVLIIYFLMLTILMGGSRLLYRAWKEGRAASLIGDDARRVIVLGAGGAAVDLVRAMGQSGQWRFIGFLDDDPVKHMRQIQGIPVFGPLSDLAAVAQSHDVQLAIIAMPSESHRARRRALEICHQANVPVMTVPSYDDLVSGRVTVSRVRPVELDDLLGRDPVSLDSERLSQWLRGRVVLVTGAGGSIGSELCRQIMRFAPSTLVLLDQNEFALYTMEQELGKVRDGTRLIYAIGDIKNTQRVDEIFALHQPSVVFHAAAYKHVPLMETDNAWQAMQNNSLGTWRLAEAALRHKVEKFVLISTDKAVNPTNVMGASKRLAELVVSAFAADSAGTRFVTVRFGNVLGSSGSVIPKFKAQILAGGPITVTHPDILRYFMSIPEAAQLVLQAGLMGEGGEIFVLDMGEPVKIADLARDLIRLSGFKEGDIEIVFTGLRPGEKLYEELLADNEHTEPTRHPKLRINRADECHDLDWVYAAVRWLQSDQPLSDKQVREALNSRVPKYRPADIEAHPVVPSNVIDSSSRFASR
jgi:FlaA1/EpsC-like NDP-sugar epimerase